MKCVSLFKNSTLTLLFTLLSLTASAATHRQSLPTTPIPEALVWEEAPQEKKSRPPKLAWSPTIPSWYITGDIGIDWPPSNKTLYIKNGSQFQPPYKADAFANNDWKKQLIAGAEVGRYWKRVTHFIPAYSLALRYQYLAPANLSGTLTQYSASSYTNYNYTWKYLSNLVLLFGKVELIDWSFLKPYISLGLGVAINTNSNYSETVISPVTPRLSPNFAKTSNNNLAYTLGIGFNFPIHTLFFLSLGYEYQNLGKIRSGFGVDTWSNSRLSFGNYESNNLLFSLNYFLD